MSDKSPSDQSTLPALSDDELRETLDRLARLSLEMFDQLKDQTKAINQVTTASSEARRAAKAAETQTNPEYYGELIAAKMDGKINHSIERLGDIITNLNESSLASFAVMKSATEDRAPYERAMWAQQQRIDRFKSRLHWVGLGAVVLIIGLSVVAPRFLAMSEIGCVVMGGDWFNGLSDCIFDND